MTQSEGKKTGESEQSERKKTDRLTDLGVRNQKKAGLYHDGRGLYLQVTSTGAKTWVLRYMLHGKAREMGLGSYQDVGLADAREEAKEARKLRKQGIDPVDHRKAERKAKGLEKAKTKTFAECLDGWIEANTDGWGSQRYPHQQRTQVETHAIPKLGTVPVADINTELVLEVLKPIWATKTVTAQRLRRNIEGILDWAKAKGFRSGDNPARWDGNLKNLVAKPDKVHKVEHHAALPYDKISEFIAKLRTQEGRDADALEFIILTAGRVGEIEGAVWDEIEIGERVWTIPAERMKGDEEHRVPLSDAAMAVIDRVEKRNGCRTGLLFPKLSDKSLARLRHSIGYGESTTHGFRSTFRDWAAEKTNFADNLAEKALAHKVGDETRRAYQRGDLLEKRRKLMDAWARYCGQGVDDTKILRPQFGGRS
jgi:integrase